MFHEFLVVAKPIWFKHVAHVRESFIVDNVVNNKSK